jgi:hypothetical protein
MFKREEITAILIITLVLSFLVSLAEPLKNIALAFLAFFIIILVNSLAKKITAFYFESEIEIKMWETQRYGYRIHHKFRKPFPTGAILPFISKIILFPLGNFIWMASLVFDIEPKVYRSAKRHGLYSFYQMNESHIGLIAASGIAANLLFALIAYLIGTPEQMHFIQLSIFYTLFNIIPFSDLDGNKIFFGNQILWTFIASIVLLSLIIILVII